jgi:hypothetical protein
MLEGEARPLSHLLSMNSHWAQNNVPHLTSGLSKKTRKMIPPFFACRWNQNKLSRWNQGKLSAGFLGKFHNATPVRMCLPSAASMRGGRFSIQTPRPPQTFVYSQTK